MYHKVLYDFYDADPLCLRVRENDFVRIIQRFQGGWIRVK